MTSSFSSFLYPYMVVILIHWESFTVMLFTGPLLNSLGSFSGDCNTHPHKRASHIKCLRFHTHLFLQTTQESNGTPDSEGNLDVRDGKAFPQPVISNTWENPELKLQEQDGSGILSKQLKFLLQILVFCFFYLKNVHLGVFRGRLRNRDAI